MIAGWFTVQAPEDLDKSGAVYCLTNTANGKQYVGQTGQRVLRRLYCYAKKPTNPHLAAALLKYGLPAFELTVLAHGLPKEARIKLERKIIAERELLDPSKGYNKTEGGEATTFSPEVKEKISRRLRGNQHAKGNRFTEAMRAHLSEKAKARPPRSAETSAKLSAALKGKPKSAEHKAKTSAGLRGYQAWLRFQKVENRRACETGAHYRTILAPMPGQIGTAPYPYRTLCCNTIVFNSQFFDSMYDPEKHDVMCAYAQLADRRWKVSLYSTKPDIDCGASCETFGGGGHKGAAGFICDKLPWRNI